MFYLSKLLPLFVYPLGLACGLLVVALGLRRRSRWWTRLVALALVLLWLGGNKLVSLTLARSLEWRVPPLSEVPSAEVILVLGGATRSGADPRPLPEIGEAGDRLLYAAWLYQQGAAPRVLVSGGRAAWVSPSSHAEAEHMATLLGLMDVPREAIWLETESRNTYENAVESVEILEREGVDRVILVTSALHMPRATRVFDRFDLDVIPAPTDYWVTEQEWAFYTQPNLGVQFLHLFPRADSLDVTTRAVKEYIGMVVYRLRGWL
jgi:uncharacterized SAM-binding protein YcdF (DUF218 family)